ncbi:MAG: chemotaxis protein CheB [Chromatiaceae bacterium]
MRPPTCTASDGADGLREIKTQGGLAFAQTPESAKYDGMPRAAMATGAVDRVLPLPELAHELASLSRHPFFRHRQPRRAGEELAITEQQLQAIFARLRVGGRGGLQPLQVRNHQAPPSAAHAPQPPRGGAQLPQIPQGEPGRGGRPLPRPPDPRHPLLPRARVLRDWRVGPCTGSWRATPSGPCSTTCTPAAARTFRSAPS